MEYKPLVIGDKRAQLPLMQGGMGVGISLGGLAGAVAAQGGIGMISAAQIGFREPDFEENTIEANLRAMEKEYKKAREAAPEGIIGFNLMVAMKNYELYVKKAVETGADLIVSGAGLPVELPKYTRDSQIRIVPIVSTAKAARILLKIWDKKYSRTADAVVIEGPLAGGHLGFSPADIEGYEPAAYEKEIQDILTITKEFGEKYGERIPVVIAGGIDTQEEIQRALELGADGVQIASAFVPTQECDADVRYKESYLKAKKEDIMIVKSPVGMPGRAICNEFIERVHKEGRIPPKKCYQCLQKCNPAETAYCITEALIHGAKGETREALLFCGANAYKADRIRTVKEVIGALFFPQECV